MTRLLNLFTLVFFITTAAFAQTNSDTLSNGKTLLTFNGVSYESVHNTIQVNDARPTKTEIVGGNVVSSPAYGSEVLVTLTQKFTSASANNGFTIVFSISAKPLKETTYKAEEKIESKSAGIMRTMADPGTRRLQTGIFTFFILYNRSGNYGVMKKIKSGRLTITKLNNVERTMSGTVALQGTLIDGTPIDLNENFTDIAY